MDAAFPPRAGATAARNALAELAVLETADGFPTRHIGPSETDIAAMLQVVGAAPSHRGARKSFGGKSKQLLCGDDAHMYSFISGN